MNAQDKDMERAYEQAQAQANSIAAMVAALEVDYDRLEELREERDNYENPELGNLASPEVHRIAWEQDCSDDASELAEQEEAANGNEDEDAAREAIQQDALSVEVRKDWHAPGHEDDKPSEFQILLCTGGPAVRIMGELNPWCEPCRAWIEYQDWGTGWMEAPGIIDQYTLLTYCRQFWFGE